MKVATLNAAFSLFLSTAVISAQAQMPNLPSAPAVPGSETAVLVGKVASGDGSVPSATINVTLDCLGTQAAQTTTDAHGNFSITVRRFRNSDGTGTDNIARSSPANLGGCEINAS